MNLKRYLPIKIFHIFYGYGWWWGKKFIFFRSGLYIVSCSIECINASYASNGHEINNGDKWSWSEIRQMENNN